MFAVPATALTVALAVAAIAGGPAAPDPAPQAPAADTLHLADALTQARSANLMLQAERLRAEAARERVPQAGAFPEPFLELGLENRMIKGFSAEDPMTMNTIGVTQMIPWPGKRSLKRDGARYRAAADSLGMLEAEAMLGARVTAVYARLAVTDRSLDVMRRTLELLRSFQDIAAAQYATGMGIQQDVLQAQVRVAKLATEITTMTEMRAADAGRLNALLGRAPTVGVGALELPAIGPQLPTVDSLARMAFQLRPALAASTAQREASAADLQGAGKESLPDLMFTVRYGQRPQYDDMATIMVGASLPIFGGSRQQPMQREMDAMRAMREAEMMDLRNETWAQLVEMRAEAERARELARTYDTAILPQARAGVEAALAAYRTGQADFMTLVDSQMRANDYAIERLHLSAAWLTAVAEIQALLGGREVTR